jgi:hypothetical protein
MMKLKGNWKKLKPDWTQEMQATIQFKTCAAERIHWISHTKRKFRARGGRFKSMNLARSLQKTDEIWNNFRHNETERPQMIITARQNVDIFTYIFHFRSENCLT